MTLKKKQGVNEIDRYNLYPAGAIQCAPAAGYSTGQAIQAIKEVGAKTLPRGYGIGWSGLAYDESRKGNEAVYVFLIVNAFVYLVLVAQYESFILPLAVILSLPVGVFGSFLFLQAMGLANDVYAQIGLVMLAGLLGKNAILIVEFAVQRRLQGVSLKEAAVEGAKLRFRPIQMTSFAFIAGLLPLVVATGAGAIGNRTIGATGAGGMLVGTVIGVLVIPGLYYLFGQLDGGRKLLKDESYEPLSEIFEHEEYARAPARIVGSESDEPLSEILEHEEVARAPAGIIGRQSDEPLSEIFKHEEYARTPARIVGRESDEPPNEVFEDNGHNEHNA
jgi:HAE1 family hydrophobic/amphiphilic exporter-1